MTSPYVTTRMWYVSDQGADRIEQTLSLHLEGKKDSIQKNNVLNKDFKSNLKLLEYMSERLMNESM